MLSLKPVGSFTSRNSTSSISIAPSLGDKAIRYSLLLATLMTAWAAVHFACRNGAVSEAELDRRAGAPEGWPPHKGAEDSRVSLACPCSTELGLILEGYVDNITFHPVPEPSSWFLLSLGIAGGVMIRRKLASRA